MVKNLPANAGDAGDIGSVPWLGRSPGEGNGNPLWFSCLNHPMDSWTWQATVHSVTKSCTQLSIHTHTPTHAMISYVEYLFMCLLAIKYLILYSSCNFEMITLRFESTDYVVQENLQVFFNCFSTKWAKLSFGAYMACKYYLRVKLWSLKILQCLS